MALLNNLLSATGAAAAAVTLTVPTPPAGQRLRITHLEIVAYANASRVGGSTPIIVTTTNMGGLVFWFATTAAIGTLERVIYQPTEPLDGASLATAMTVVCPGTTGVMWRINCAYHLEEF